VTDYERTYVGRLNGEKIIQIQLFVQKIFLNEMCIFSKNSNKMAENSNFIEE